jgi:hypothetical protein
MIRRALLGKWPGSAREYRRRLFLSRAFDVEPPKPPRSREAVVADIRRRVTEDAKTTINDAIAAKLVELQELLDIHVIVRGQDFTAEERERMIATLERVAESGFPNPK